MNKVELNQNHFASHEVNIQSEENTLNKEIQQLTTDERLSKMYVKVILPPIPEKYQKELDAIDDKLDRMIRKARIVQELWKNENQDKLISVIV